MSDRQRMGSPSVLCWELDMNRLFEKLKNIPCAPPSSQPNMMKIPCHVFNVDEQGAQGWNEIYWELRRLKEHKQISLIERTNSGGISYRRLRPPCYDVRNTTSCLEATIIMPAGMWRIQFRNSNPIKRSDYTYERPMFGREAFTRFTNACDEFGIDIYSYAITNGLEVKAQIEKPLVMMARDSMIDVTFENVHHADFHSSYGGGLKFTHPEFGPVVDYIYTHRHEHPEFKSVLNMAIGFMQSEKCCKAKWAHLSRDAIRNNNDRVKDLARHLTDAGRMPINYNTDGIWYAGEVYHGPGEGKNAGEWENDWTNCLKFRCKSKGAYEFISSDGKYNPVIRGLTKLDRECQDRRRWRWGDIYSDNAEVFGWRFVDGVGLINTAKEGDYDEQKEKLLSILQK